MRSYLLAFVLPLLLAACDNNSPTQQPAAQASQPAAAAPAVDPAVDDAQAIAPVSAPAAETPAAAPAVSAALDPLLGNWAASPANCDSPIVITADAFQGAENSCRITGWTDNGDGTYTAALTCQSAGETASESIRMEPLFGPQGEGIRLDYVDRGGDPVTVFECRAGAAQ